MTNKPKEGKIRAVLDKHNKKVKISRFMCKILNLKEGSEVTPITTLKVRIHNFIVGRI